MQKVRSSDSRRLSYPGKDDALFAHSERILALSKARKSFRLFAYLSISMLLSLSTWMLLLLPFFLTEKGWSSQKIGWAMGTRFLFHLLVLIFSGHLAERYGNVPIALLGTSLAFFGGLCYLASLWWLDLIFLARIFHGTGVAMVSAGVLIHLVQSAAPEFRGRIMGYFGMPGFVVMGLGPLLSEHLINRWGMVGTFVCIPLTFLIIAGIVSRLPRPLAPGFRREPFLKALHANLPRLKSILVFSMLFGFCFSAWHGFLSPAVSWIGSGAVSAFGFGYGGGALITRLGISQRLDTGSRRLLAVSSLVVYGLGLVLIPHAVETWQLTLVGLLCGASHGIYYPGLSSIAADRFHPVHTGSAMSLYTSASLLGMFLGPPAWGLLSQWVGYPGIFTLAGCLLAVSSVGFTVSQRARLKRHVALAS